MLGDVNKLFVFKSLLTMPSNFLPLHPKQTFLPMIWIFTDVEGDVIEFSLPFKKFSTLITYQLIWVWLSVQCCLKFKQLKNICQKSVWKSAPENLNPKIWFWKSVPHKSVSWKSVHQKSIRNKFGISANSFLPWIVSQLFNLWSKELIPKQ